MKNNCVARAVFVAVLTALAVAGNPAGAAAEPRQDVIDGIARAAKSANPIFGGFSAERGQALYEASPATGKADTPSCTTCHSADPRQAGRTRAGKAIEPMAVSKTDGRYTDAAKVEKWFGRNCRSVLGRECTAQEKGDFIAFMIKR